MSESLFPYPIFDPVATERVMELRKLVDEMREMLIVLTDKKAKWQNTPYPLLYSARDLIAKAEGRS